MSRAAVAGALREEGGLIAAHVVAPGRVGSRPSDRAFAAAAVREGYLLHYGEPELVRGADPGLALLAGDRLYALGLARLAAAGDLEAVAILADLISRCADAHARGEAGAAGEAWREARRALARCR